MTRRSNAKEKPPETRSRPGKAVVVCREPAKIRFARNAVRQELQKPSKGAVPLSDGIRMAMRLVNGFLIILPLLFLVACSSRTTLPKRAAQLSPLPATGGASLRPPPSSGGESSAFSRHRPAAESLVAGIFPKPIDLEPQVAFWRNVYAVWSRSEAAVHDNRYMVVYEIVQLPGEIEESYTPMQKMLLQERLDEWRDRLRGLEYKLTFGLPLNGAERQLADRIARHADLRTAIRGASERVRYQRGLRERFLRGLQISVRYDRLFRDIFRRYGLPEELAFLPHVESSFQENARSSAGAVGIWQFTPAAAKTFIGDDSLAARLDPVASAHGAARYLRHAYDQLGSWPLAITSYNHGIGGMKRAKDRYGHDFMQIIKNYDHPQFGFASRNYYAEFLAACEIALQPELFFAEGIRFDPDSDADPGQRPMASTPKPPPTGHVADPSVASKAVSISRSGPERLTVATHRPADRTLTKKSSPATVPVRYLAYSRVTKTAEASANSLGTNSDVRSAVRKTNPKDQEIGPSLLKTSRVQHQRIGRAADSHSKGGKPAM